MSNHSDNSTLERITLDCWLPAAPAGLFAAWIDGDLHGQMTESAATSDPQEGGRFTAWDGYIEGTHLTLTAPTAVTPGLVVQLWRTDDFEETDADSLLEVQFVAEGTGTRLSIVHSRIPAGGGAAYFKGWQDFYFGPMIAFFGL